MDFSFTAEQEKLRQEIEEFLQENVTPEFLAEKDEEGRGAPPGPQSAAFLRKLAAKGWKGFGWPKEYGGEGRSMMDLFVFYQTMDKHDIMPGGMTTHTTMTTNVVALTLMRVGNEEQKREFLPKILAGEVEFAIGYTEPGAGSDLTGLQTRAVREGDDYVINGQKVFTGAAHYATHIWLLARTDPTLPKHRGLSLFMVPMNTPGITVRPLWTFGDGRVNETFFEEVRVPATCLVGEENRGWYYVAMALDYERLASASSRYPWLRRQLDELIQYCRETRVNGTPLAQQPGVRWRLVQAHIEVEIMRLLVWRTASMINKGLVPNYESSAVKTFGSELRQRMADAAMNILGPYGLLKKDSKWAAMDGAWEQRLRASTQGRFGAGSNEIQRDIIARRGLGLPRG